MEKNDLLKHITWRPKLVPKPTLMHATHSLDMRGLRKLAPDPYLDALVKAEQDQYMQLKALPQILPLYEELCLVMEQFTNKYGADFDKNSLKSTAALSLVPPCHTFLDEFGAFTMTTKATVALADPSVYLRAYEVPVADIRQIVASYPRGKNTGLPIIVSGGNRFTSNVVNVINLIVASVFQQWMYEKDYPEFVAAMEEVIRWMNEQFGYATSQVVFSRYQHNGKAIPVTFTDTPNQWFKSTNLFMRRRIVNSTIKYIAMALKAAIKVITEIDLNTPAFEQDRSNIRARIAKCERTGGVVLAIDQSRFDLRHGGDKAAHLYGKVMGPRFERVFGRVGKHLTYLSTIEASSETLIPTRDGVFAGDGTDVLKSGESATSRKGSYMNLVDDMTITRESLGMTDEQVNRYYLKHQPSAILGDDLLKLFPSHDDATKYVNALEDLGPKMGIGMEIEKPSKFLGSLVVNARDPFNASPDLKSYQGRTLSGIEWLQPMGSIIQKTVFPERFRSERFPTFGAIIKFIVIPFDCISPDDMAKHPSITPNYLTDVKNFLDALGKVRRSHSNTRYKYFQDAADHFPTTREDLVALYRDLLKNPSKYGLDIAYDFDEILNALFKGLEFDVNWSVVGLDVEADDGVKGKLKDVTGVLIEEISPDAKASNFIINLIREANANYKPDPSFVKFMYDTVIRNHKLLGLRYSPGLPIY